jgi:hypothetical protein
VLPPGELNAGFAPSGVTVSDEGALLEPANGSVPDVNPPVEA